MIQGRAARISSSPAGGGRVGAIGTKNEERRMKNEEQNRRTEMRAAGPARPFVIHHSAFCVDRPSVANEFVQIGEDSWTAPPFIVLR
jgi:hypothetical protein